MHRLMHPAVSRDLLFPQNINHIGRRNLRSDRILDPHVFHHHHHLQIEIMEKTNKKLQPDIVAIRFEFGQEATVLIGGAIKSKTKRPNSFLSHNTLLIATDALRVLRAISCPDPATVSPINREFYECLPDKFRTAIYQNAWRPMLAHRAPFNKHHSHA